MRVTALVALAVVVAGCGGADKTPVAHVAGATITRGQLNSLLGKDHSKATARELQGALGTLIHFQWVRAEAKADHVTLTDAERKKIASEATGAVSNRELD